MILAIDHVSEDLLEQRLASGKYRYDPDLGLEKRCSACKEYLPADSEFFFAGRDRDGLHCQCKVCNDESRHRSARLRRQQQQSATA